MLKKVYQFHSTFKPHISYRFHCSMWPYNPDMPFVENIDYWSAEYKDLISYTIKKISIPTFKINTDARKYYGNTQYVIPTLNFGQTEMSITFEETDRLDIYRFLANNYGINAYERNSREGQIVIRLEQYDESMSTVVDRKYYIALIKNFNMPSFNNNGYGSVIELEATFYVMYVYDEPLNDSEDSILDKINNYRTHKKGNKHSNTKDPLIDLADKAEQQRIEKQKKEQEELPKKEGNLPKGKNKELITEYQVELFKQVKSIADNNPEFDTDIQKFMEDEVLTKAEKDALKAKYNINDVWLDDLQGSMAAQRLFTAQRYDTRVQMSAEEYTNARMFLNNIVQHQIDTEISKGNKNWKKHTKEIIDENGEKQTVVFYSYSGKASYVNKNGEVITSGFNRDKKIGYKDQKVEDMALHTTGTFYADLDVVLSEMARGGQSMMLFENFGIVREETLTKGRVHSAFNENDYVEDDLRLNTLGVEVVSASGVSEKRGLHTTHATGSGEDTKNGYIEIVNDDRTKISDQVEAISGEIEVGNEKMNKDKGSKFGIGLHKQQLDIIAGVTLYMNDKGVSNFDFENAEVDTNLYDKNNKVKNKAGTQILTHESVSYQGKEAEAAPDLMIQNTQSLANIHKRNPKKKKK